MQSRALSELNRILKPNGKLIFGTKNRYSFRYFLGGKDHNGLRFGPVLPLWCSDILSRIFIGRPYRVIIKSYRKYEEILRRCGFGRLKFYWPKPGYQFMRGFYDLTKMDPDCTAVVDKFHSGAKASLLKGLYRLGILKFVVPHYLIVAEKGVERDD